MDFFEEMIRIYFISSLTQSLVMASTASDKITNLLYIDNKTDLTDDFLFAPWGHIKNKRFVKMNFCDVEIKNNPKYKKDLNRISKRLNSGAIESIYISNNIDKDILKLIINSEHKLNYVTHGFGDLIYAKEFSYYRPRITALIKRVFRIKKEQHRQIQERINTLYTTCQIRESLNSKIIEKEKYVNSAKSLFSFLELNYRNVLLEKIKKSKKKTILISLEIPSQDKDTTIYYLHKVKDLILKLFGNQNNLFIFKLKPTELTQEINLNYKNLIEEIFKELDILILGADDYLGKIPLEILFVKNYFDIVVTGSYTILSTLKNYFEINIIDMSNITNEYLSSKFGPNRSIWQIEKHYIKYLSKKLLIS